jgi:hypothetical protein
MKTLFLTSLTAAALLCAAAELTADHFAGSHDPAEQANGQFLGWRHVFCPGDGDVDGADDDAYEAAYFAGC